MIEIKHKHSKSNIAFTTHIYKMWYCELCNHFWKQYKKQ